MILERRKFLRLLGLSAGAVGAGCSAPNWLVPDRLVELALRGPGLEGHVNTVCGLCEGACGLTVRLVDDLPVGLRGNPRHPLGRGGLCPVGQAGLDVLYAPERLTGPLRRDRGGVHHPVTWDEALGEVASRIQGLYAAGQGHRVAFLVGQGGGLLLELFSHFAAALGCPNLPSQLDGAALAHYLTQGISEPLGFDLGHADVVLSFGLDVFEDGHAPVYAAAAMAGARAANARARLVHVGTRLSPSAAKARPHVPVLPGTHGALALGVAHVLVREGAYDREFVAEHTFGFEDWTDAEGRRRLGFRRLLLERYYPDRVARLCGCEATQLVKTARTFAGSAAAVAVAGGEATWGSNATSTVMAVHALNALVGAFDRPGGVVMPAKIPFTPLEPVQHPGVASRSIFAPAAALAFGADPVATLAERVLDGSYPIEVLVVVGANPVYASPAGEQLAQAMEHIPLVCALAPFRDETAARATLILPSSLFLESWQEATTPSSVPFSILGVGAQVIKPLADTRHPGETVLELARRIGGPVAAALGWPSYVDYLKFRLQGLVLSGQGAVISGSFEESWVQFLEERGWRFLGHSDVNEFWADLVREGGWWNPVRMKGDWGRLFQTPSGRFEFHSQALERKLHETVGPAGGERAGERGSAAAGQGVSDDEAFLPHFEPPVFTGDGEATLVPFRTSTARGELAAVSPMVLEMFGYPVLSGWQTWVEVAPETAAKLGLGDGDLVAVESAASRVEAVLHIQAGAVPGVVHMPLGLGHSELAGGRGIGVNPAKVLSRVADPLAGTLSLTSTRVRLQLLERRQHGGPAPMREGAA